MSLTAEEIVICNQALDRIGSKNFTITQLTVEAIKCNTIYDQTRDALLCSFEWPFASGRKVLAEEKTTPDFEWDHQYKLPDDFLRLKSLDESDRTDLINDRYEIEGDLLLTNYDTASIKYVKKITDTTEFHPLFTEVLILSLARKLIGPLAGTKNPELIQEVNQSVAVVEKINKELVAAMSKARTVWRNVPMSEYAEPDGGEYTQQQRG